MAHGEVIIDVNMNDKEATQSIGRLETGLKGLTNKVVSGGKMFANMLGANLISAGVTRMTSSAINTISQSIDGAISRVDTLDNANRVFENMGFSANDTKIMMNNLNDSITGLPTTLDGAIGNIQKLTSATQDIHGSEQIFSALNNAVLGFGGSASDVDSVVNMFSRSLARGQVMGDEWNTMFDQMAPVLNALADEMGYTVDELRTGLSDGTIEVGTFTDALLTMNEEGGGGLASLEQIAQDSTKGIRTSMANARTAITRGVATIVQNLNAGLESAGLPSISEMIGAYGTMFNKVLIGIANNLDPFINLVKTGVDSVKAFAEGFMSTNAIGIRLQNMFANIRSAFSHVVSELFGGGGDITETFRNIGVAVSNAITPIVTFVGNIYRYVRSLDIAGTKNAIFERLQSIIASIDWGRLVDLATTLRDGVGNAIMFVVEKIQELWEGFKNTGAIDAIITAFGDFKEMIASNIESFSDLTGNMREGSFSFESIGAAIGKVVEVGAKLLSWLYKASSAVSKFLTKVNPNIILGVVGAFGAFKILQKFNPFSIFQRNAEKGLGGITRSSKRGGGIITQIFKGLGSVIVSVGKSINQVLTGLSKVVTSVAKGISTVLVGVAKSLSMVVNGLAKAISTLAQGIARGLSIALKGLATAIRMIPIPHMLAFALAVGVVVAALTLLATQGDGVKKMLEGLGNAVATVVEAFGVVLVNVLEAFGRVLQSHGETIVTIIDAISEGFANFAESVGEAISTVIEAFEPLVLILTAGMIEIAKIISDTIIEIVEILSDYLPDILEFWDGVIEKIPDIIDAFGRLSESIGRAIATIIEALGENAQGIIRAFGDVFEQAGGVVIGIINALNDALPNLQSFVTAVIDAVGENLPPILDAFGETFKDMGEAVEGIIKTLGEQAPNFAGAVAIIIGEIGVQARTTLRVFGETFEKMGKTVEGVIDAFGEFHTTFSTNIGNLLDVIGDNATKVFESFAEAFGDMSDDVSGVIDTIGELSTTFSENIGSLLDNITENAISILKTFSEEFGKMGEAIEGVVNSIGENSTVISESFERITEALSKLDEVNLLGIGAGLGTIGGALLLMGDRKKGVEVLENLNTAFEEFPDILTIASNLSAVALAMEELSKTAGAPTHIKSLGEAANKHHEDISNVASALDSFPELATISSYLQSIGLALELVGTNGSLASTSLGDVNDKMTPLETNVKNVSTALANLDISLNATRLQSGNTETALDKLKQTIENLGRSTSETLTRMTNQFNTGLTAITNLVTQSSTAIQNVTTQTMNTVTNSISTGLRTIQTQFSNTLNNVNTIYTNTMNNMVSITTRTSSQLVSSVRMMMNAFVSAIRNASNPIRSAMSSNINSAVSVARTGISPMVYIGQQIGNGLARGMNSALGTIRRAAQNMINEANRAARARAMIHSPSRLFEREIGRYLPEGVAVGIERNTPVAMQSMESMIDRLSSVRASAESLLSVGGVNVSRQGIARSFSTTQTSGGKTSQKAIENALNKSNELLSMILDKPTDVILDGKPITDNVNHRNAKSELIRRMKGVGVGNV